MDILDELSTDSDEEIEEMIDIHIPKLRYVLIELGFKEIHFL